MKLKILAFLFVAILLAGKTNCQNYEDDEQDDFDRASASASVAASGGASSGYHSKKYQTHQGYESHEEEEEVPRIDSEGDVPNAIAFDTNSEQEHMHNFKKISNDLKVYEEEYTKCLKDIPDEDYTEDKIDECVGKNFIKVVLDIKYETLKIMARADTKVRRYFIDKCYISAGVQEDFSVGCDLMEKDSLDLMWNGMDFVELLEINKEKYMLEYGKVPEENFDQIMASLVAFGKEFFELLDEVDSHKEVTILRLKTLIDDRTKLILEDAQNNPGNLIAGDITHTIDIDEKDDVYDDGTGEFPDAQIENGAVASEDGYRPRNRGVRRNLNSAKGSYPNMRSIKATTGPGTMASRLAALKQRSAALSGKNKPNSMRFFNAGHKYAGLHAANSFSKIASPGAFRRSPAFRKTMLNRVSPAFRAQVTVPFKNVHRASFRHSAL